MSNCDLTISRFLEKTNTILKKQGFFNKVSKIENNKEIKEVEKNEDDKDIKDLEKNITQSKITKHTITEKTSKLIEGIQDEGLTQIEIKDKIENSDNQEKIIGILNSNVVSINCNEIKKTKNEEILLDLQSEIYKNKYPLQKLIYSIPKEIFISNIDYIQNPEIIRYLKFINQIQFLPDKTFRNFIDTIHYFEGNQKHEIYTSSKALKKIDLDSYDVNYYKIKQLPNFISYVIRSINFVFSEISKRLIFNNKDGFYYIKYQGHNYRIICRHIYMMLENTPLEKIFSECVTNNQCKYCDEVLVDSSFIDTTNLPFEVRNIINETLQIMGLDITEEIILNNIYQIIGEFVVKSVKQNSSEYVNQTIAVTCAMCYKILLSEIENKKLDKIPVTFLNKISQYFLKVNWTMEIVDQIIKKPQFDIYSKILDYIEIIKTKINNKKTNENIDEIINTEENFIMFYNLLNNINLNDIYNTYEIETKNINSNISITKPILETQENSNILEEYLKTNCPVNTVHEFSKNICKHCGYEKSGKNSVDIVNKYITKFNSFYNPGNKSNVKFKSIQSTREFYSDTIKRLEQTKYVDEVKQILNLDQGEWLIRYEGLKQKRVNLIFCLKSYYRYDEKIETLNRNQIIILILNLYNKGISRDLIYYI